ncbi:MAG: ergothioneine biosynthesis protein EgtB [Saprospiraceae bacterium]
MLLPTLSTLKTRFHEVRSLTEQLCNPLEAEDMVVQPSMDVSPPKWHLGHTTWFFENFLLVPNLKEYILFDPSFNYFFNSYYESQGPRVLRSQRGNMTRPTAESIKSYRKYVNEHLENLIDAVEEGSIEIKDFELIMEVGLQHEQQHQELLVTDIKYILGNNPLFPAYHQIELPEQHKPEEEWLSFDEGVYDIGYIGDGFCWDNEMSAHKVHLESFAVSNHLVTNGEYLEFMEAGGYENFEFWLSEGWEWVKSLDEKAPLYWFKKDGEWWHYTLHGFQKVEPNLPVTHISYFEADAFANWKGMRLPTEFEWEVACKLTEPVPNSDTKLLESGFLHPVQTSGNQFWGNTWEWTSSAYLPYPKYPRFKGALGEYNGKFMINQMVLRGGSVATPESHIRNTYRNFFHPDKRWQFTGFRLAKYL